MRFNVPAFQVDKYTSVLVNPRLVLGFVPQHVPFQVIETRQMFTDCCEFTLKIIMEHDHGGLEDHFPF